LCRQFLELESSGFDSQPRIPHRIQVVDGVDFQRVVSVHVDEDEISAHQRWGVTKPGLQNFNKIHEVKFKGIFYFNKIIF
jgi:hypothetical protein